MWSLASTGAVATSRATWMTPLFQRAGTTLALALALALAVAPALAPAPAPAPALALALACMPPKQELLFQCQSSYMHLKAVQHTIKLNPMTSPGGWLSPVYQVLHFCTSKSKLGTGGFISNNRSNLVAN